MQLFGTYPSTKPLKRFIWLWGRICDLAHVVAKFSMNIGLTDFLFLYTETEREKRQTVVSPTFQNFVFHERPALIPGFGNLKMSEESFCLCEKRQKAKIAFTSCPAVSPYRGNTSPAPRASGPHQPPPPQLSSASPHPADRALDCCLWASMFYFHLFCVSLSKICLKVPEKPKRS